MPIDAADADAVSPSSNTSNSGNFFERGGQSSIIFYRNALQKDEGRSGKDLFTEYYSGQTV